MKITDFKPGELTPVISTKNPGAVKQLPNQPSDSGFKLSSLLPAAGGIVGALGGGALGTLVEPGGGTIAGGVAGGAGGQAIGEWLRQVIDKQPTDAGSIVKQGAIGGIFGAIPGGEEGGIAARMGIRAATGAVVGASTKAVEQIGSKDDFATSMRKAASTGLLDSLVFPAFGGALDMGTSALKFIGEKVPGDLYEAAVQKPKEVATAIYKSIQGMLVGHNNIDYAVEKGIIPKTTALTTEAINTSFQKAKTVASDVENKLQSEFKDLSVPYRDVSNVIQDVFGKIPDTFKANKIVEQLQNVLFKGIADKGTISAEEEVPLKVINDMKKLVSNFYKTDGVPQVYSDFRQLIENKGGEKIKALNEEAFKLMNIKDFLKDWQGKGDLPEKLSPQGIANSVADAAKGNPKSLQALLNTVALGGYMTIGGAFHTLSNAELGIGAAFGLRSVISKFAEAASESPETKIKIADALKGMYAGAQSMEDKANIMQVLRQMGIRVPSAMFNQAQQ